MVGLAMLALRRVSGPGYTHLASLSIRSPKPGVSTIVREMRVPSSSSSVHLSTGVLASIGKKGGCAGTRRTDGQGLDLDTLLDMGRVRVIAVLMSEDGLVAEGVDEGGSACCETALSASETHDAIRGKGVWGGRRTSARGTTHHEAELDALLHVLLLPRHFLAAQLELADGTASTAQLLGDAVRRGVARAELQINGGSAEC